MISKRLKLRLRSDKTFFKVARRNRFGSFLVYAQENPLGLRVIVIIPKHTAARATQRTRIKRSIYALLKSTVKTHPTLPYSLALVLQPHYNESYIARDIQSIQEYFSKKNYVVTT